MWISVLWELIKYGVVAWILSHFLRFTEGFSRNRFLAIAMLVATAIRIAWLLYAPVALVPGSDNAMYHEASINIMEGRGDMTGDRLTAWHAVGYKWTLALIYSFFGVKIIAGQLTGIILGVLCVWLTYSVAEKLFEARVARAATIVMALFPGQIFHVALLGSEIQSQFFYLLSIYAALKAREEKLPIIWLIMCGIFLGIAALTRPAVSLLGMALVIIWKLNGLGWKRCILYGAVVGLISIIVITPWLVRNYRVFNEFVPISTQGGISLWLGANPYTHGDIIICPYEMKVEQYELMHIENETVRNREARRRAMEYIRANPIHWMSLMPAKAYYLYQKDEDGLYTSFTKYDNGRPLFNPREYAVCVRVANAYYGTVMILFTTGVIYTICGLGSKQVRLSIYSILIIIFFHTLPHVVLFSMNRYNHTVMPLIAIGAGFAIVYIIPMANNFFSRFRKPT